MARKKKPLDAPTKPFGLSISLRFDSEPLVNAVDAYAAVHRQSRNSAILTLLERALRGSGDYPARGAQGGGERD